MKINTRPVWEWLGYSRRERRASLILMLLLICVISVRYFVPERRLPVTVSSLQAVNGDHTAADAVNRQSAGYALKTDGKLQKKERKRVELNSCDTSELIKLPGIGPVLSVRIIKYRNLLGGYAKVDQLTEVYGLPAGTFELVRNMVKADSLAIVRIRINEADYKTLLRFPYFEHEDVRAIVKYRELKHGIKNLDELVENRILSTDKAKKVSPYLVFE